MITFVHYDSISLDSSLNEKCFNSSCSENQNAQFLFNNFFFPDNRAVCEIV